MKPSATHSQQMGALRAPNDAKMPAAMETAAKQYVEFSEGDYFVTASRVLLEAIVSELHEGHSPEIIQRSFPTLRLAQVYGAIAFYLDHQAGINAYLQQRSADYEVRRQANISQHPEFHRQFRTQPDSRGAGYFR